MSGGSWRHFQKVLHESELDKVYEKWLLVPPPPPSECQSILALFNTVVPLCSQLDSFPHVSARVFDLLQAIPFGQILRKLPFVHHPFFRFVRPSLVSVVQTAGVYLGVAFDHAAGAQELSDYVLISPVLSRSIIDRRWLIQPARLVFGEAFDSLSKDTGSLVLQTLGQLAVALTIWNLDRKRD